MACTFVWMHTNDSQETGRHSSCCPAVHLIAVHCSSISLFSKRSHNANICSPENNELQVCSAKAGSLELVHVVCFCVAACFHLCMCVCEFSELEQGAWGGVFCCSWGATVPSPNRSLVPAVVPGEASEWGGLTSHTRTHTQPLPAQPQLGLPHHPGPAPLGLAERQRGSGVGVGWDVLGGVLWPLSY